ncbi:MAG TPA: hypothetical protein VJ951_04810, partial [Bacteroidales bacterium]|nr:hypothetical protein [Bacteroidales bacterium]
MDIQKFLTNLFGNKADRDMKEIYPVVEKIQEVYKTLSEKPNDELRERSKKLRERISEYVKEDNDHLAFLREKGEDPEVDVTEKEEAYNEIDKLEAAIDDKYEEVLNEVLPEAFAIVRETARRFKENDELEVTALDYDKELAASEDHISVKGDKAYWKNRWIAGGNEITWDMVHYDVQLIGGVALHQGRIAEMATGEGKTLVATLPVFLNALTGKGVHLITVNDYLAKRDAEWMGPIYQFHGLTVDCIDKHQPNSDARRKAYSSDIAFGTNNEFGFDYLRDNM